MNRKTPLVVYHYPCQDGFTAAWACRDVHPDWEYYPATHGEPFTADVTNRDVYMLDFSYKRQQILEIAKKAKSLTILDHHKSAEAELQGLFLFENIGGHFNINKSGAGIAWEYFHKGSHSTVPAIVKYAEDRDLWKFKYAHTKAVSAWLFSQDYTFESWDHAADMIDNHFHDVIRAGEAILQNQAKNVAELCEKKFRFNIGGYDVWCVNVPYIYASDACELIGVGEPFSASFYYTGTKYIFSLRSDQNSGLDVSEIAKKYGGGGHAHAAGFEYTAPLFELK